MKSRAIKKRQRPLARRTSRHNPDRSRFQAASHDIRQPLHALGLFVAQLRGLAHEAELKGIVERIDTAVSSLNERLIELLHLSEVDAAAPMPKSRNKIDADSPTRARVLLDRTNGKLIVVIDDDPLVLDSTCGLLRSWGCTVVAGDSGRSALAALLKHQRPPDLIISDFRLSGSETGIDAIAQLRTAFTDAIPALLVSGDTGPEPLHDARAGGFLLLPKPVDPMRLRAVLNRGLKVNELKGDRKRTSCR
jgi:CheY-like chemotaxis protein